MLDRLDLMRQVEFAELRSNHQSRYQLQISYLKAAVGEGAEYVNPVARAVVSSAGAYYELLDLPEEFAGSCRDPVAATFVSRAEATDLLRSAAEVAAKATWRDYRRCSVLALYRAGALLEPKHCWVSDFRRRRAPDCEGISVSVGRFQPDAVPLFYRIMIDTDSALKSLGMNRGLLFCLAGVGDRNLVVRIAYESDNAINLGAQPAPAVVQ